MTRRLQLLTQQLIEKALVFFLVFFSACLRRFSSQKWESAIRALGLMSRVAAGGGLECAQSPFKQIGPESGGHSGFRDVLAPSTGAAGVLPVWAHEIRPFLANQLSEHTRRAYENDLKQFFGFASEHLLASEFTSLRTEHIILYRKALEEGRISGRIVAKSTINRKLAVVKSFLQWLRLNRLVTENPAQLVKGYPQTQESSLLGLSDDEAKKILEATSCNSPSKALHCAILHCLLYLGLRKAELISLRVGDWDTERGVEVLRVRGKGHRVRVLPLTDRLKIVLLAYFRVAKRSIDEKEAPLFIPTKNPRGSGLVKPLTPYAITYIVLRYARRVGIMKKISPHSCRATCISNALDKRASHRSVQHLAGWTTPLMIQRYDKRREEIKNSAAFSIEYGEQLVLPG